MSSLTQVVPHLREIDDISNACPAVVTTDEDHGYYDGIFVTINIPYPKMMPDIAGKTFLCKILSPDTFALYDIQTLQPVSTVNSGLFDDGPFVRTYPTHAPPPVFVNSQHPQAVPAGEIATTLLNVANVIGPNNPQG